MEKKVINISDFILKTGADDIVALIKQQRQLPDGSLPAISDMIKTEADESGKTHTYEYVNYVQEGGGVLGVALLGYTYILEKLGIRFYKLAGTSAGAINTMLTAAVNPALYKHLIKKNEPQPLLKSEAILYELINKDLFELVDGAPFARKIIKRFLQKKDYMSRIIDRIIFFLKIFLGATALLGILNVVKVVAVTTAFWWWIAAVTGAVVFICVLVIIIMYLASKKYLKLFVRSKYGICAGNNFHEWVTQILNFNKIISTADLEKVMKNYQEGVHLKPEKEGINVNVRDEPVKGSDMILIASDITNQRKVEFPAMAKYYWDDAPAANPADFVRASMAIPIFFEPFIKKVTRAPQTDEEKMILQNIPPTTSAGSPCEVRFVDGGILSNFPINVFHNPNVKIARLPTFGVKLQDEEHEVPGAKHSFKQTLFRYIGNIFNTIRFYYDRDFLLKNQLYEKTIGHVDVHKFNWLNFFLNEADKVQLFKQGAEAAKIFFLGGEVWVDGKPKKFEPFDWEKYKVERANVVMTERNDTPGKIL